MNARFDARFDTARRFTPAGVSTAAMMVVMLVMGASTLWTDGAAASTTVAGAVAPHLAQVHVPSQIRKS